VDVVDAVDNAVDVFADIITSDPEWVDAEFEAIIAGLGDAPRLVSVHSVPPPGSPAVPSAGDRRRAIDDRAHPRRYRSSIRSPPTAPGRHRPEPE